MPDLVLAARARVHGAARRAAQEDVADAAIAVDAARDRGVAARELRGQLGVGDQRAAPGDEVGIAVGDRALGHVGRDAPDRDHRHVDAPLDPAREPEIGRRAGAAAARR